MTSRRPRLSALLLVVAFSIALAVTVVAVAPAATAPKWIVFSAHPNGTGNVQLFRIQTTGAGIDQITAGALPAIAPSFSPDGKRIVFSRLGSGVFGVNLDGTGVRRLTSNGRDSYPVWSPDGTRIAFLRPYQAQWRVFVMSSTGRGERLLRQAPPAGRPSWTPDGKAIMIPSAADLITIDARTGKVLKYAGLTLDIQVSQTATVSPNGLRISYIGPRRSTGPIDCGEGRCPHYALYTANVPAPHRARRIQIDTGAAGWSPDNQRLVFLDKGLLSLWNVGTGKVVARISTAPHTTPGDSPPAWQPR